MENGIPVESFDWRFEDRNGSIHRYENLTALKFYEKFVLKSSNQQPKQQEHQLHEQPEYVTITDDPNLIYGKLYTFSKEKALYEGKGMTFLNVPIDKIKKILFYLLSVKKTPVYVRLLRSTFEDSSKQVLSNDSFDFITPFGIDLNLTRSEMLQLRTFVTQDPMIICGYNRNTNPIDVTTAPLQWCGESFGQSGEGNGYYCIYDSYLNRNLISITIPIELLNGKESDFNFNFNDIYLQFQQDSIVSEFRDSFIP